MAKISQFNIKNIENSNSYMFEQEFGLKRDQDDGSRQVSFMSREAIDKIANKGEKGWCMKRFRGNIVTQDLEYTKLVSGQSLLIGQLEIEITTIGKACYSHECPAFKPDNICLMMREVMFGRIIHPGRVSLGDEIILN